MKKILLYTIFVGVTLAILLNPALAVDYARNGLELCAEIIIPSLFPFFVCSGLLIYSGFCQVLAKIFEPVMKPVFGINGAGAAAFVLGIISGYPLGALTACQLYESSYVSKSEAERLLAFCNNSGPLFILGSIGVSLYHSPRAGIVLYAAHILAALIVGILFRFYQRGSYAAPPARVETPDRSLGELFSAVLANSIQSILTVCGAVLFFSVVTNIVMQYLPLTAVLKPVVLGLFEFVTGITALSNTDLVLQEKLVLSAAIVGFAGLSVHVQVMGVVSRHMLSLKPYLLGKVLHGAIAAFLTYVILQFVPVSAPVFRSSAQAIHGGFAIGSLYSILTVLFVVLLCILCAGWLFLREWRRLDRTQKKRRLPTAAGSHK